jgi:hypothetical protein
MARLVWSLALVLLMLAPLSHGAPVDGTSWSKKRVEGARSATEPGTLDISQAFAAGQRACVIVIGDHNPIVDVEVKVYDSKDQLVAQQRGQDPSQDFVAVMWYPPRQQTYRIEICNYGKDYNECSVAIK